MKRPVSSSRVRAVAAALLLPLLTATLLNRSASIASRRVTAVQSQIADVKAKQADVQDQLDELKQASQALGQSLSRGGASSPASSSRTQATDTHPQSWTTPPPLLPSWEPDSPYIWLEKGALTQLPLTAIEGDGRIQSGFAEILGITPAQKTALESALQNALQRHMSNELAHAKVHIQPPPPADSNDANAVATSESAPSPVDSIEVVIPALGDEERTLVREFEEAVEHELGVQRKTLLLATSQSWLDEEFSYRGENDKRYQLQRLPDGSFQFASVRGPISMSRGGVRNPEQAIPAHLVPLFAPLSEVPPRGAVPSRADATSNSNPNP